MALRRQHPNAFDHLAFRLQVVSKVFTPHPITIPRLRLWAEEDHACSPRGTVDSHLLYSTANPSTDYRIDLITPREVIGLR